MLNASIVLYQPDWEQVVSLTKTLLESQHIDRIYWIDNSPTACEQLPIQDKRLSYQHNPKNIGYGAAHNIAIRESIQNNIPLHLVVNPDIILDNENLDKMVDYIKENPQIGSLMPKVKYPNGDIQYLCKLLPTPLDVLGRRFLPKTWTRKRNERYEMRQSGYNTIMNIPYLSGCFMLLKTEALKKIGLFDERYFMYPEDMDLTRRIHKEYQTVFYPHASIVHNHAKESYKSLKMLYIHISNMCKYFNKWGWLCDAERKKMNKEAIRQLNS